MKFPLFFLLALFTLKAAAFGLYGCYERLIYWQAYQMENGVEYTKQKIAPGCARDDGVAKEVGPVKGKRCNLRQFLWYITNDLKEQKILSNKNMVKDADLAREKTSLDVVADKLYKAGVGGFYQPNHIYKDLKRGADIDQLINYVASFMQIKSEMTEGKPAPELFDLAEKARSRVEFGRKAHGTRDIGTEMREKYDKKVWDKQPKDNSGKVEKDAPLVEEGLVKEKFAIPEGGVGGWRTCDLEAAKESVNAHEIAAGRSEVTYKTINQDFIIPWKRKGAKGASEAGSHERNIKAVQAAKEMIEGGCSA